MYKVIIAEDNYNQRKGLSNINFSEYGMELIGSCENGKKALEIHKRFKANLIITDIVMPEMDGLEFLTKAREISDETFFIITSGHQKFSYAQKAIELGVIYYLLKPFNKRQIIEKLKGAKEKLDKKNNKENNYINKSIDKTKTYSISVKETIHFVEENYKNSDLTLQEIASNFGYGYTGLSRDFHAQTGARFKSYLGKYRIEKSIQLLKNTNYMMYEVAEKVGLNIKNFNRLFIKHMGITPTKYRKNQ